MGRQHSEFAGRRPEQLALALLVQQDVGDRSTSPLTGTPALVRRTRSGGRRSCGPATTVVATRRTKQTPSRDSRGRFVAYPTTSAPSWYVFCAAGYRIPGDSPAALTAVPTPVASLAARRTKRPRSRPWITRDELHSALLVLIVLVASAWYAIHLPRPHR